MLNLHKAESFKSFFLCFEAHFAVFNVVNDHFDFPVNVTPFLMKSVQGGGE